MTPTPKPQPSRKCLCGADNNPANQICIMCGRLLKFGHVPFFDQGDPQHKVPEDMRIDQIGTAAMTLTGERTGAFLTDSEPGKAERYIEKLTQKFPRVRIIRADPGPTPGCVTVIFGIKPATNN